MIILDTNIISELMKPTPDENVWAWVDVLDSQAIVTTAITSAEILFGINTLPTGKKRTALLRAFEALLTEDFAEILPFDQAAAESYAVLQAQLRNQGTPIGQSDAMIASIAGVYDATLATRNIKHFETCGIDVVNPFAA